MTEIELNDFSVKGGTRLFERVMVVVCAISLGSILGIHLLRNSWSLNWPELVLISIFVSVCLAEGFDKFQIGKLLSLSRERNVAVHEATELKDRNSKLLDQLVQMTVQIENRQQQQVQVQFNPLQVAPASQSEKKEKAIEEKAIEEAAAETPKPSVPKSLEVQGEIATPSHETATGPRYPYRVRHLVEQKVLKDYLNARRALGQVALKEVKITGLSGSPDPISTHEVIFDGYVRDDGKELFIRVLFSGSIGAVVMDRVYAQLARVLFYKSAKNVNAALIVLLISLPDERDELDESNPRLVNLFTLTQRYAPALLSGLLHVDLIKVSEEEIDKFMPQDQAHTRPTE